MKTKYEYAENNEIKIRVTISPTIGGTTVEYKYLGAAKWLLSHYKATGLDHLNVNGILKVINRYINFNYPESC